MDAFPEQTGYPRIVAAGEAALVVEFGDTIDEAINHRVIALDAALEASHPDGILETVATYRSLLVQFDPLAISPDAVRRLVTGLLATAGAEPATRRRWRVPVCYGGAHGADLDDVARLHGLDPEELVAIHSGATYRVYMIGFAPGFVYLGGLPERIHTDRRPDPRMKTPPRSVSIGGRQAGISPPLEMPSGWHLLGQTPARSYDPARTDAPFLFRAGDLIRFVPVSEADYRNLCHAADAGDPVATLEADDA
jgi:KipI family sensor histidine kinase inhibitor